MELKKVYNSTEDAFDSADSIYKLFDTYFKSADKLDFLRNLRDTESVFEECFAFSPEEISTFMDENDKTHYILFNKWLNDIRRISGYSVDEKNKFFERVSDASHEIKSRKFKDGIINSYRVKTAFNKISNRVKKMGSVSQMSQINGFESSFNDPDVVRVMEILDYFSNQPYEKEMINIRTNSLLAKEPRTARDSVFLAFVPQKLDVYRFVNTYLQKCIKYNIPYNIDIPYDKTTKRLVKINSTIADFGKNLAVIKEIADEHPEMIDRMDKPPLLCGHVSGNPWIGIGSYSCKAIERTPYGFTEKRADTIYDTIENNAKKYIIDNYKKPMFVHGKKGKLKDHIIDFTTNLCIGKIRTMVEDYYKAMAAGRSEEEAEIQVKNYFGFEKTDLYHPKYLKKLSKSIALDTDSMIMDGFEQGEHYGSFKLPNPGFGPGRILHMEVLPQVIKKVTSEIAIKDPIFLSQTLLDIQTKLKEKGIDKKACYESYVADKMLEPVQEVEAEIINNRAGKKKEEDKER